MGANGKQLRAMPEGFEADAFELAFTDLKNKYHAGNSAIKRWRREVCGIRPSPPPVPDDFLKLSLTMCRHQLEQHYRTSWRQICAWVEETGVTPRDGRETRPQSRRPLPDDFRQIVPGMTRRQIQQHYRCSGEAVIRWLDETGIVAAKPVPNIGNLNWRMPTGRPTVKALRNYSLYDEAADVLRRFFAVYRCDERGRANPEGKLWRVGNTIVDGDELLSRAARKRIAA